MPYGGINMYSSASGELQKFMALAIQDSGGSGGVLEAKPYNTFKWGKGSIKLLDEGLGN